MANITGLNMIKAVFAALGAKTSDSNYAVPLLSKTTAEPKGYMDMASLASVLGGIVQRVTSGSINDDAFKVSGRWYLTDDVQDLPSTGYFILETLMYSQSRMFQRLTRLNTGAVRQYIRTISTSESEFSAWFKFEGTQV